MATNNDDDNYINITNNNNNDEDNNPVDAYKQSLSELVMNSKPHIMMLTMLAEELKNICATKIVDCIVQRLLQVNKDCKLPTLYLIDSIIKNVPNSSYLQLFQKHIVKLFCHVFEKSDEKQRLLLYKLRQTWNQFFNQDILYQLDCMVKTLDPGWPILAKKPNNNDNNNTINNGNVNQQQQQQTIVKSVMIPMMKTQTISTTPPISKPIEISKNQNNDQRIVLNSKNDLDKLTTTTTMKVEKQSSNNTTTGTAHPTIIHLNQIDIISKRNQIENELRKELINKAAAAAAAAANNINNNNNNNNNNKNQNQSSNIFSKNSNNNNKISNKIELSTTTKTTVSKQQSIKQQQQQNKKSSILPSKIERKRKSNDSNNNNKDKIMSSSSSDCNNKKMKIPKRKRQLSPTEKISFTKQIKKNPLDEILSLPASNPPPPDDIIPLGSNHHISVTKRSKEQQQQRKPNNVVASKIKNRRQSPPLSSSLTTTLTTSTIPSSQISLQKNRQQQSSSVNKLIGRNNRLQSPTNSIVSDVKNINNINNNNNNVPISTTIQPTVLPAPNIFSQPEILFNNNTVSSSSYNNNDNNNFVMDRDYRREYDAFMNDARNRLNAGTISRADHEILIREAEREFFQLQQQQPSVTQSFNNLPFDNSQQQQAPHVSTNQQTSTFLEPPYGSSALFINKQFCRLFYLDSITGIVPFKTHADTPFEQLISTDPVFLEPKQVYFSGHPTKVIIDPGTATEQSFILNFNNPTPYLFYLSGVTQPQKIMLGLPDRELIVNDRPYKAQFGGAPVQIYFESDRQTHLILLSDSKPFLQVSDEPRYDLWNRLVDEAKAKMSRSQLPPPTTTTTTTSSQIGFNFSQSINLQHQQTSNTMITTTVVPTTNAYSQQIVPELLPSLSSTSTTVTTNVPSSFQQQSISSTTSTLSSSKPSIPDLDSLLMKLSAAGLISNKTTLSSLSTATATTTSVSTTTTTSTITTNKKTDSNDKNNKNNKTQTPQPKRFLPLEMSKLKQYHQFAIDQLYNGVQCTNCSLRFTNESDSLENKSRYARHLDWHFRQNRRLKNKPGSGSSSSTTTVSQRRSWYYTIDEWLIYKEVNDNVDDNNGGFFDSNFVDSPNTVMHRANEFSTNFSQFKDYISEFELFIEVISCDNLNVITSSSSSTQNNNKICSVVADSDATICCTVCNEPFKIEWYEDEEEWRLINAVSFNNNNNSSDEHQSTTKGSSHYHPLCLKDHLLQLLDKQSIQTTTTMEFDQSNNLSISDSTFSLSDNNKSIYSSDSLIPGLDMPIKDDDDNVDVKNENDDDDEKKKIIDIKNENIDDIEMMKNNDENGLITNDDIAVDEMNDENTDVNKNEEDPESFEVKVEEFEITIETIVPPSSETIENNEIKLSNVDGGDDDEHRDDENDEKQQLTTTTTKDDGDDMAEQQQQQPETKPKRPLIVLKMKNSSTTTTTTNDETTTNNNKSSNIGNVSVDKNDNDDNEHSRNNINNKDNDDDDDDQHHQQTSTTLAENLHNNMDVQCSTADNKINDNNNCNNISDNNYDNDDNDKNEPLSNNNNKVQNNNDDNDKIIASTTTTNNNTVGDEPKVDSSNDDDDNDDDDDKQVHHDDNDDHFVESINNLKQQQQSSSSNENDKKLVLSNDNNNNNDDECSKDLIKNDDDDDDDDQKQKQTIEQQHVNYYSRGKEVSSLCTIM